MLTQQRPPARSLVASALVVLLVLTMVTLPVTGAAVHPPDAHASTPHAGSGLTFGVPHPSLAGVIVVPERLRLPPAAEVTARLGGRLDSEPLDHPPR